MASNPVAYAEETLGVHAVWQEGQQHLEDHQRLQTERLAKLRELKDNKSSQSERSLHLATVARGKYNELSATAFKEKLKEIVQADDIHRGLVAAETEIKSSLDEYDSAISHAKMGVEIATARMKQLGGLLEFYAAAKAHSTANVGVSTGQQVEESK